MTEEEARAALDVPRETLARLEEFVAFLSSENERQNLVSRGSLSEIWSRHILDSAQLIDHAPQTAGSWLDIGSGAGFPGLITALLFQGRTILVEPRKLRVDFLNAAAKILGVEDRTTIIPTKLEAYESAIFDVISARAFAPLPQLFDAAERFAAPETQWVLPKGRKAKSELEAAESLWQGDFRVEPSRTDPEAWIIVAERVERRSKGRKRK